MNRKTVFRNVAIFVLILLGLWGWSFMRDSSREYRGVDTSVALTQLNVKNAKSVQIDDREQQLRIELKKPIEVGEKAKGKDKKETSDKITAKYPARGSDFVFESVRQSGATYQTNVKQDSAIMQMLALILPLVILLGLFFFVMNRMQGGGRGGMMGFGRSRAKEITRTCQDDVRRRRRCRRGRRRALRDQRLPAEPEPVRGTGRHHPQRACCSRPARYR